MSNTHESPKRRAAPTWYWAAIGGLLPESLIAIAAFAYWTDRPMLMRTALGGLCLILISVVVFALVACVVFPRLVIKRWAGFSTSEKCLHGAIAFVLAIGGAVVFISAAWLMFARPD